MPTVGRCGTSPIYNNGIGRLRRPLSAPLSIFRLRLRGLITHARQGRGRRARSAAHAPIARLAGAHAALAGAGGCDCCLLRAETHVSVTGARRARRPAPPLPPPRFVCLGAPLATCALPKGVCYLLTTYYLLVPGTRDRRLCGFLSGWPGRMEVAVDAATRRGSAAA